MQAKLDQLPLTEEGRKAVLNIVEAASRPLDMQDCVSCGKSILTLQPEDAELLHQATPGPVRFDGIDVLCLECSDK